MKMQTDARRVVVAVAAVAALLAVAPTSAMASTIDWTAWGAFATGDPGGAATGVAGSVAVSYAGEVDNLFLGYPSWGPAGTFDGGTVGNAPPSADGIIQLTGGDGDVDTITFFSPVVDPVMAIWSLGSGGTPAQFDFLGAPPLVIESGGPSNEYAGSSIVTGGACGVNVVCGNEGNGTIQFLGTVSSISWINPQAENWYGFTVGVPESASPVPEPASLLLLGTGLVGAARRSRKSRMNG